MGFYVHSFSRLRNWLPFQGASQFLGCTVDRVKRTGHETTKHEREVHSTEPGFTYLKQNYVLSEFFHKSVPMCFLCIWTNFMYSTSQKLKFHQNKA